MPNGIFNWTFKDAVSFLKANGFDYAGAEGSHHHYKGMVDGKSRLVQVPFHGAKTIKPRTLKSMIAQSGLPQKRWTGK